ncbi:hypothetical protein [Priestia megaterium]|uniref:hypothetical protein n=1 Tax=Priestia megaterium TaxID=1404 RepID=UPI00234EF7D4|nr:hypothetical protein [Priestia megaterium]MDC7768984.1 hypothetical protein [Priestia megaterium]
MIEGQGEDSCGKSGTGETPQERKRRGGSAPAESETLHGNQQRCNKRFILNHFSHFFVFRLAHSRYVSISFLGR